MLATGRHDLLHTVAAGTAGVVGEAFLRSLVRSVGEAFELADVCFVSELLEHDQRRARVLASWPEDLRLAEGAEYDIDTSPCQHILERDVVAVEEGVPVRYPRAPLVRHRLESYLGVPMRGATGAPIGIVGVMSRSRLEPTAEQVAALKILAARAGAELDRRRSEAVLRERETEIAASRARVVQAADEERRRIGRDLHDGVQQRLVILTQRLDVARRALSADDQATAEHLVAEAREHAAAAGQDLRELAHGLHPAGLTERGLDGALRLLGARSPLPLELVALPGRRLPDTIEVTVYYLVSEAISNAVKHAGATRMTVSVHQRGRTLHVEVADDGVGGAGRDGGSGLRGLGDRVGALGGTLDVTSPPGAGTRLSARIPLAPFRDARDPFLEFGHDGDEGLGERLIELVLSGRKTASVSLAREWELEGGAPRIGQPLPIMDHRGVRRGTVEVVRVAVLPFSLIDEDAIRAESAGTATVEEWRETQWRFYEGCRDEIAVLLGEPGWRLCEDEPMVITWFRLVGAAGGA